MLKDLISNDLKEAMKSKDAEKTRVLRNIKAKILEIQKTEIGKDVTNEEIINALTKLAKERNNSIEMYEKGNRPDLVEPEKYELEVIQSYLPKQLSESEIEEKVKTILAEKGFTTKKDMGSAIKAFKESYPGAADGKLLSEIVKRNLN